MTLSPDFLDELRARTVLSSLVGKTVKLTKAGREMKGCCPFHNEKTPSFYVNDDKAFYHCFGCSAHGDAIRWLTEQRGLTFMDAVQELAQAAGMEVPASQPGDDARAKEYGENIEVMERAQRWFIEQFMSDRGQSCRNMLRDRGVRVSDAAEFGLGFAPYSSRDTNELGHALKDVAADRQIKLGLARESEERGVYDFFRSRLIIPIHDSRGRCIAFGGRAMGDGQPKYLNSPDSPIFDKGRTLFNIHRAAPASRKSNRLIVVEGYLDVIAMTIAGLPETVAPNGTALTETQLGLLWRQVNVPILCFDGDKAGRKAAERAAVRALPMLEPGKSLAFVFPPEGKDPDDVLRSDGAEAVKAMFETTEPLVDVLWRKELLESPTETPEERAGLWSRLKMLVGTIRHADVRSAYGAEMLTRYQERFPAGAQRASSPRNQDSNSAISRTAPDLTTAIEAGVLWGLIMDPEMVAQHYEAIAAIKWKHAEMNEAAGALVDVALRTKGLVTFGELVFALESVNIEGLVPRLQAAARAPFTFTKSPTSAAARQDLTAMIYRMTA